MIAKMKTALKQPNIRKTEIKNQLNSYCRPDRQVDQKD